MNENPKSAKAAEETAKLTATYVNQLASGIALIGGVAPVFTFIYSASPLPAAPWQIATISLVCFLLSGALHWGAKAYLKREMNR